MSVKERANLDDIVFLGEDEVCHLIEDEYWDFWLFRHVIKTVCGAPYDCKTGKRGIVLAWAGEEKCPDCYRLVCPECIQHGNRKRQEEREELEGRP
jgi:hypothetical protein